MDFVNLYIAEFRALHVNRRAGKVAPHKAILMLSIIDLIESGHIYCNRIYLDDALQNKFKEVWLRYIKPKSIFQCSICYPFFHLSYDKFWTLIPSCRFIYKKEYRSISSLQDNFECALIDSDLFHTLQNHQSRERLRQELIHTYINTNI